SALGHQAKWIDLDGFACRSRVTYDLRVPADDVQERSRCVTADSIKRQTHQGTAGGTVRFRSGIRSGQKNNVRAYLFELVDNLGSADDIDRPEAFLLREYDYGSPYAGIRGVLNDPITGLQGNELLEKQCGRRRIDAQHRRLLGIDLRRQHDRFFSRR